MKFRVIGTLRNSSHLSASSRHPEDDEWRCLQNEDGVENTLGTTNYSFSLFYIKNYFIFKDHVIELAASQILRSLIFMQHDGAIEPKRCY